jgi:acyl carrier protein
MPLLCRLFFPELRSKGEIVSEQAMVTTEDRIRNYSLGQYPVLEAKGLTNEDSLVGVLDSLAVVGLIGFIEPEFSIELSASDLTDENFETILTISQLVGRLKGSGN